MKELLKKLWEEELKGFVVEWLSDLVKSILVLIALGIFYLAIEQLKHMGYKAAWLEQLELLHFCGAFSTIVALIVLFLWKLIAR